MIPVVAWFEKVSLEQYIKDVTKNGKLAFDKDMLTDWWNNIKLPTRATSGSAGYDFYMPHGLEFGSEYPFTLCTGIRCCITDGWFLAMFPRSGLGFKYGVRLENTVGIIDSDYYNADNEGHIVLKLSSETDVSLQRGDRVAQGIFLPFGITVKDNATGERIGGFGSTGA